MRTAEVIKELHNIQDLFERTIESATVDDCGNQYIIKDWPKFERAFNELIDHRCLSEYRINRMKKAIESISLSSDCQAHEQEAVMTEEQFKKFKSAITTVNSGLNTVTQFTSRFSQEDVPNQINIKMPGDMPLSDFLKTINDVELILNHCQAVNETNDRQPVTVRVDSGSNWLLLSNMAPEDLLFVGKFVATAYGIAKMHVSLLSNWQDYRVKKSRANYFETIAKEAKQLSKARVKGLTDKGNVELKEDDNDRREKLEKALEMMSSLMVEGLEVHAPLVAPKETKLLYPKYGELQKLAVKELRELAKKNEDDE